MKCQALFALKDKRLQQTKVLTVFSLFFFLFLFFLFLEKRRLDISFESSARQGIHMKCQALFALKDTSKNN